MTGTNCDLFTHKSSRSYLNHLVYATLNFLHSFLAEKAEIKNLRSCSILGMSQLSSNRIEIYVRKFSPST
jgi:hypothetical protein